MTFPEYLFAFVAVGVGLASLRANPTGVALMIAYAMMQGTWFWLPGGKAMLADPGWRVFVSLVLDFSVLAVVYCKPPRYDCYPYHSFGRQVCALWLELSYWDRLVVAGFGAVWIVYFAGFGDYLRWWALYWLTLAQLVAAGGETFEIFRRRIGARAADGPDISSGATFAWAPAGSRGYG